MVRSHRTPGHGQDRAASGKTVMTGQGSCDGLAKRCDDDGGEVDERVRECVHGRGRRTCDQLVSHCTRTCEPKGCLEPKKDGRDGLYESEGVSLPRGDGFS